MLASGIPTRFGVAFASGASGADVRSIPVTSSDPTAASQTLGFPPNCFLPTSSGGTPPNGADFNGVLLQLAQWAQWQAAGGVAPYDAAFSTAIGGYPSGAVLASAAVAGYFWFSLVDNNTSNPDTGGANWASFSPLGGFTTGDVKSSFKTTADPGWVAMNDGSIGSAASGATTLAAATTLQLFALLYGNVVDAWAPIQTSTGSATTRAAQGAGATAFAANCRLVLPKALGRALCAAGAGAGLTSRALGQNLGEETHQLTVPELASHPHPAGILDDGHSHGNDGSKISGGGSIQAGGGFVTSGVTINPATTGVLVTDGLGNVNVTASTGGNVAHNNMQPSLFLNPFIKL